MKMGVAPPGGAGVSPARPSRLEAGAPGLGAQPFSEYPLPHPPEADLRPRKKGGYETSSRAGDSPSRVVNGWGLGRGCRGRLAQVNGASRVARITRAIPLEDQTQRTSAAIQIARKTTASAAEVESTMSPRANHGNRKLDTAEQLNRRAAQVGRTATFGAFLAESCAAFQVSEHGQPEFYQVVCANRGMGPEDGHGQAEEGNSLTRTLIQRGHAPVPGLVDDFRGAPLPPERRYSRT